MINSSDITSAVDTANPPRTAALLEAIEANLAKVTELFFNSDVSTELGASWFAETASLAAIEVAGMLPVGIETRFSGTLLVAGS